MDQILRSEIALGSTVIRRDGEEGIVVGILFRSGGTVSYAVAWPDGEERWHYPVEFKHESKVKQPNEVDKDKS